MSGRTSQKEGTARAKAQRRKQVWCAWGIAGRLNWPDQRARKVQGGGKSRQGGSYAEQDGIALNRAGRHCVLTGSSWIDQDLVETQWKTTISQFLKHRLKKLGPSIKPRQSFMIVHQRKITRDIQFSIYSPSLACSYCYCHVQYHSLPTAGIFCEQNTIENLHFRIHSLLARNSPGWTFGCPAQ